MQMAPAEVQAYSDGYQRRTNREAWLNGLYTLDAVTAVVSAILSGKNKRNVYQYPKQPRRELLPMTEAEKQAEIEADALRAELYMRQMVRAGKNWGGGLTAPMRRHG